MADIFSKNAGLLSRIIFRLRFKNVFINSLRVCYWRLLGAKIGKSSSISKIFITWPHQVAIGQNCILEHFVYFHFDGIYKFGPNIKIGNSVFLGTSCEFNIRKSISIGNNCLIAAGTRFIDHDHNISGTGKHPQKDGLEKEIVVHDHVWVGANAVILKGVTINEGAVVAAGAVVTHSIPPNEIWAGVPAKRIGIRNQQLDSAKAS